MVKSGLKRGLCGISPGEILQTGSLQAAYSLEQSSFFGNYVVQSSIQHTANFCEIILMAKRFPDNDNSGYSGSKVLKH